MFYVFISWNNDINWIKTGLSFIVYKIRKTIKLF